jgi:hypothetical protein
VEVFWIRSTLRSVNLVKTTVFAGVRALIQSVEELNSMKNLVSPQVRKNAFLPEDYELGDQLSSCLWTGMETWALSELQD